MGKNSQNCVSFDDEYPPYKPFGDDEEEERRFFEQHLITESPYPQPPKGCHEEGARRQDLKCATLALHYYNKKHHTDYELVDALTSSALLNGGIWYHCNFTAKPKSSPGEDCDQDSSTKLFFAEMLRDKVTACRPLKGKMKAGCESCCEVIKHPTHGFSQGLYRFRPYRTRSRSQQ